MRTYQYSVLLLAMLLSPLYCDATVTPAPQSAPKQTEKVAPASSSAESELATMKSLQAELRAHKESLERQADRHFSIFEKTVDRVVWAYGIIGAVILGVLFWMFGSTQAELKVFVENWMRTGAQKSIDDAAAELRVRIDAIRGDVASLLNYKDRKIAWVCPPSTWRIELGAERNLKADANQEVLRALHAAGLHNIKVLNAETSASLDLGTPDLVIVSFDGTPEGRQILSVLIEQLKRRSPPVFLIVDTFMPGAPPRSLGTEDFRLLENFLWYVPVNFPSQLVAQAQLLIRRDTQILGSVANG